MLDQFALSRRSTGVLFSLALWWASGAGHALAQQADTPPVPGPAIPAPSIEERLQKLEQANQQLSDQNRKLQETVEALSKQVAKPPAAARSGLKPASSSRKPAASTSGSDGGDRSPESAEGLGAAGTAGRTDPGEAADRKPSKRKVNVLYADGLLFSTDDDEFQLAFHNLTQAEFRGFPTNDQGTLKSQFFVPRERWYFTGRASKHVEFYTSTNRGYGAFDLLDAFITFNLLGAVSGESKDEGGEGAEGEEARASPEKPSEPDRRLRLRVGRTKVPYLYEYYQIAEGDLIAPERSLYAGNLALNRQVGAMFLGELFKNRLDYAVGVFNGPRRSFEDSNSDKDAVLFLNSRPFLKSESFPALHYLNLGGSINGGFEKNAPQPGVFRTANDQTPNASVASLSPTFLQFNNNVVEHGERVQWAGNAVWFRNSLSLLAEYGGGFAGYSVGATNPSTSIPFSGYMLQASYFLTGERMTRRVAVVQPRHNFGFRGGKFSPGAIEVHARYSELNLSHNIFSAGLADPNLWSNEAQTIDLGINWYFNFYTKVYLDWQHSEFGQPVLIRPRGYARDIDLFWLRFQLFF